MVSIQLSPATQSLRFGTHLLGFSGGVDSVALFFILLELEVRFDIAIVHYHTRAEADEEVSYAKALAQQYNKKCFIAHAPQFTSAFEHKARNFRFGFFDELIATHHYQSLILAHQLNDRFEWLMMQLTQGSGLSNLLGFEDRCYPIIRPLESTPKEKLYEFCKERHLRYFEDTSNTNTYFKRNDFRQRFCNELIRAFGAGIAQSLHYLNQDKNYLLSHITPQILHLESLYQKISSLSSYEDSSASHSYQTLKKNQCAIFGFTLDDTHLLLLACDKIAKLCGYVLSAKQREEIVKAHFNCKIHHLIIAKNDKTLFIAFDIPYLYQIVTSTSMSKSFKALCAKHHIPPKLRLLIWGEFHAYAEIHSNSLYYLTQNQKTQQEESCIERKIKNFFAI